MGYFDADAFAKRILGRMVRVYLIAPLIFLAAMEIHSWWSLGHFSDGVSIALYLLTIVVLLVPGGVSVLMVALVPPGKAQSSLAAVLLVLVYPISQIAAYVFAADALSSSLPDDPPLNQQIEDAVLGMHTETILALSIATGLAVWVVWPSFKQSEPEV